MRWSRVSSQPCFLFGRIPFSTTCTCVQRALIPPTLPTHIESARTYFNTPKVCVGHRTFGSSEQPFSKISVLLKCSLMDIKSALLDLFVKLEKILSGHRQWA
jgi:hypothetical protein